MFDAILAQELKLPGGQLDELSQRVPLPTFVKMKQPAFLPMESEAEEDDSFFHYHFLAQVAHRILLTRTKSSIFFTSTSFLSVIFCPSVLTEQVNIHRIQ